MTAVIETHELTKVYGKQKVVDQLTFEVRQGEVFGFLGPNGAGKTTTILMLLGLSEPTSGNARVLGFDPVREPLKVKGRVGCMPENVGFYDDMTARENLQYVARLNSLTGPQAKTRIDSALENVKLADEANKLVGAYSRGMRQRLGIAEVLIKNPKLIILDEPTLGLDPEGINSMLELIKLLSAREGMSVLLCSHLLQQTQKVCDRVGILNQGRLVAKGTIEELAGEGIQALLASATGRGTPAERRGLMSLEDIYMRYFEEE
jgi:ABC-2 type transport system ATP-binding protein